MNTRTGGWLMIFFLTGSIFTTMFVSTPNDNIFVSADSVIWENEYGRLEVEPSISTNIIRQKQWYNLTWYYPSNTVDIAFGFNDSLSYGQVFYWNGTNYNKVNTGHTTYNDQHFYTISNVAMVQDENIHGFWEYDIYPGTSGKWDMYAKLSSDSWSTAFSTGRIIHLDPWWDSSWNYRKDIFIDASQVGAGLNNFPVYVNISDSDLVGDVQNDIGDIVFVDTTNTTKFNHEIEYYSVGGTVEARIWVNVTSINSGSNTHFNMYYGNLGCANQDNPTGVWDSNYLFVYHMNQSSGAQVWDSTANTDHGTYNGSLPTQILGIVGYGQSLDNDNDWVHNLMPPAYTHEDGTQELWINVNVTGGVDTLIHDYLSDLNYVKVELRGDLDEDRWDFRGHYLGADQWNDGEQTDATYTWQSTGQHWADGDEAALWRDGDNVRIDASVDTSSFTTSNLFIGALNNGDNDYAGVIDEFRYSDIKRNDSWMAASYNTIVNHSTFISFGSELTESGETVDSITGLTATTMSLTNITLDWTQSSNGNYTIVEYNTVSSWARGTGTEIYNGTAVNHSEWNLTGRTLYYFGCWGFNESFHNYSNVVYTNNHTGPTNPTNINTDIDGTTLNFTWTKNSRAQNTVIIRKENSYPSVIGDGTEIYNGSAVGYDDTTFTTSMFYTFFAHNITCHISSTGQQSEWGALKIYVYDENTSEAIYNYTVFVTNQSGSETYEKYSDGNQIVTIDISSLPTGENVIVKINASVFDGNYTSDCVGYDCDNMTNITIEYEDRVYYIDIAPNTFYNLSTYLPRVIDSYLYRLTVYGPIGEYGSNPPVEDATMDIKRYINSTVGWESIGIYITDGEGNIYIYLIPGELYKITITHDDYLTSISDYIPSDAVFVQSFRLVPTTSDVTGITYDDFWTNITVDISIVSAGCWQDGNITVTYTDINSSTTNTQIRLFEIYGTTTILLNTWNNASNSFFNINGSINTSRMHYISLYFNTTATYAITQPVIILIPNVDLPWCGKIVPFDLDDRITDIVGPFTIGDQVIPWTTIIGTIIPIIILVSFGPFNTGIGIIGCGISMAMMQGFLNGIVSGGFQWGVVGIGAFITIIGIIYIMTKGTGGDHL